MWQVAGVEQTQYKVNTFVNKLDKTLTVRAGESIGKPSDLTDFNLFILDGFVFVA